MSCTSRCTTRQAARSPGTRSGSRYLDQDTDIHLVQEDLVLVQFGVSPRRITDGEPSREFGLNVVLVAVRRIEHQGWGDCDLYVVVGIIF